MRKETPFTVDEAKAYITESVKVWETSGIPTEVDRIIALAGHAYNQRNKKATVSTVSRLKSLNKDIKSLQLIIKRSSIRNSDTSLLREELLDMIKERDSLAATITPKPRGTYKVKQGINLTHTK